MMDEEYTLNVVKFSPNLKDVEDEYQENLNKMLTYCTLMELASLGSVILTRNHSNDKLLYVGCISAIFQVYKDIESVVVTIKAQRELLKLPEISATTVSGSVVDIILAECLIPGDVEDIQRKTKSLKNQEDLFDGAKTINEVFMKILE